MGKMSVAFDGSHDVLGAPDDLGETLLHVLAAKLA